MQQDDGGGGAAAVVDGQHRSAAGLQLRAPGEKKDEDDELICNILREVCEGASIKYVRRNFGIFDPPPPLSTFHATYQYCLSAKSGNSQTPLPPSVRTYLMEAPDSPIRDVTKSSDVPPSRPAWGLSPKFLSGKMTILWANPVQSKSSDLD